jgi:TonB family protein
MHRPPTSAELCETPRIPGAYCHRSAGITPPSLAIDRSLIAELLSSFYPPASIAAKEEGTAGLIMCVDSSGRSREASIFRSSGYKRLDDVSLIFVRNMPLKPATLSRRPVDFCGHAIHLAWLLP